MPYFVPVASVGPPEKMHPSKADIHPPPLSIQEVVPKRREILYDGYHYDVTEFIKRHPGGRIIEFYTENGEDATVAIQQFHQRSSKRVMSIMESFKRRPASDKEVVGLDGNALARYRALTEDFIKLYRELEKEGYFKPSLGHVAYRILEVAVFAAIGIYLMQQGSVPVVGLGILSFAMFFGRSAALQHECGHLSLTGDSRIDRFVQTVLFGVIWGLSPSWWSSQHNRHHAMPQRLKRDVDLETLPLLAFNTKVVKNPKQGRTFFIRNQALLFIAVDTFLVAMLWKVFLCPRYVIQKRLHKELVIMLLHYIIAYHIGLLPYVTSLWLATIYLLGNFSLSHTHLPVTEGPLHWVEYAFLHTADIERSWWCDWWMAYLNYQVEHHLFPTMPQFKNRLIQDRVKAFAAKHNIPYHCMSYTEGVKTTFANLVEVSKRLGKN